MFGIKVGSMIFIWFQMMDNQEEFKVGFSSLERGQLYPIVNIEKTESKFYGKVVKGLKVEILDGELKLVTYLPKKMLEAIQDTDFNAISEAAKSDQKYSVC